jgi:hypothetical protein
MVTYAGVITLVLVIIMSKIGYSYLYCSDYISFGNNYDQNRLWLPMLQ